MTTSQTQHMRRTTLSFGASSRQLRSELALIGEDVHWARSRMGAPMDDLLTDALDAAAAGNWEALKLLLHPYLHWNRSDGATLRGRTNVLRWLASQPAPLGRPARFELRDGQIYRWWTS